MRAHAVLGTLIALATVAVAGEPGPLRHGDVLGPSNWQAAQGLLPEEILNHYRRGEYVNRIVDVSAPGHISTRLPPDIRLASQANLGRYGLRAAGSIIELATGAQPSYIVGLPFPDVEARDPDAAIKIVWNYFYATWHNGNCHFLTELVMVGQHVIEREVGTDVRFRMYDGAPEARGFMNPNNLLQQNLADVVSPADLQGIVSLTWRFRDPDKHDALWTYVPGLRRARQVTALNRSDGFMGSDISLDDGPFFDGKPEDFSFRLLGRTEQLVLFDPYSVRGEAEIAPVPGGGWRILWKDVPRIGAETPGWQGLPWAPVSAVLVRRPVWAVEATPRDPLYLYARLVLRFNAETYHGTWASKYDRAGALLASYQVSDGAYYTPDGGRTYVPAGGVVVQIAENFLYGRATAVLFPPSQPQNPSDYRVPLDPDLFNVHTLVRLGCPARPGGSRGRRCGPASCVRRLTREQRGAVETGARFVDVVAQLDDAGLRDRSVRVLARAGR